MTEPSKADQRFSATEMLVSQFEGLRVYAPPQPWSIEQIDEFLRDIEDARMHVLCAPERVNELRLAVALAGLGAALDVVGCPVLGGDLLLFAASDAEIRKRLAAAWGPRPPIGEPGNGER